MVNDMLRSFLLVFFSFLEGGTGIGLQYFICDM